MKISKCPKTVSGKHIWGIGKQCRQYVMKETFGAGNRLFPNYLPECSACKLVDDKKKSNL